MDTKKMASDCYRKGVEATEKKNWDLAVEMYGMCVRFVPDNLAYRQLLRNSEFKKYNDNKSGAGALAKSKLLGIRSRIKKARTKEEWNEVDKACEEGLAINPWDVQLNLDLAEAAKSRQYMDVARFALSTAWNADQNNKQLSWSLAELLEERGEYDEASKVWQHICKLDPNDGTARSKLTGSHTKKTLDRGGYESAAGTREVMMNRGQAGKGAESAAPGESQEADFKHAIRKEPAKVENYLKLADFYKRENRLDEAHTILEKGLEVSGGDPNVRELLEDVELLRMKENLEKAKERAAQGDDDTARKNAAALSAEYNKRRLEVLTRRVERYPQDLTLKFDLGQLLMAFAKWPQAIPLLQQASQNKRIKVKALALLGKCFMADKKLPLAKGQLERAVAELSYDEDPKLFLDTYYNLARICEETGDKAAAENCYGEILVRDYEYKDARQRLERLQGGGDAEAT
jgi:tetratricopeptide (TPR) repeat protein